VINREAKASHPKLALARRKEHNMFTNDVLETSYIDDIETQTTDLEMETIIADDDNSAVAMEVALTQLERIEAEEAWLNAKDGNLALCEENGRSWDSETDAFDRQ